MELHDYEVISFDCFGTLVDWESGIVKSIREGCQERCDGILDKDLIGYFLSHESAILSETPDIPYRLALAKTYEGVLAELGVKCKEEHSRRFGASVIGWPIFPDTIDALSYLGSHHKLVVLSNIDEPSIESTKDRLRCDFFRTYTAQAIGTFKPSANNFRYLTDKLSQLHIPREKILHVSVSRFHDIDPAAAHGIDTAWINRAGTANGTLSIHKGFRPKQKPTYQFSSLSELVDSHKNSAL